MKRSWMVGAIAAAGLVVLAAARLAQRAHPAGQEQVERTTLDRPTDFSRGSDSIRKLSDLEASVRDLTRRVTRLESLLEDKAVRNEAPPVAPKDAPPENRLLTWDSLEDALGILLSWYGMKPSELALDPNM